MFQQSSIISIAGLVISSLLGPASAAPQQAPVPIVTVIPVPDTCQYETVTGTIVGGTTIFNKRQNNAGPLPTLPPQAPYSPAAPISVLNPGSHCTAAVTVNLKSDATKTPDGCGRTVWTSTVTSAISVDCQGCNALQWGIGGLGVCSGDVGTVVTATTPSTTWPFACATSA